MEITQTQEGTTYHIEIRQPQKGDIIEGKIVQVKPDEIIVDIGTNFDENGKLCGDVDFERVKDKVKAITPVPGGVGPVTLALLLNAVIKAAYKHKGKF